MPCTTHACFLPSPLPQRQRAPRGRSGRRCDASTWESGRSRAPCPPCRSQASSSVLQSAVLAAEVWESVQRCGLAAVCVRPRRACDCCRRRRSSARRRLDFGELEQQAPADTDLFPSPHMGHRLPPELDLNLVAHIISTAGPASTSFIEVFKAYNDVLQACGLDPADDVVCVPPSALGCSPAACPTPLSSPLTIVLAPIRRRLATTASSSSSAR